MTLKFKRNLPIILFLVIFLVSTALIIGRLPLVAFTLQ